MVFHWSLSDNKFPQVSTTLLGILAVLNNVVVWMVSLSSANLQVLQSKKSIWFVWLQISTHCFFSKITQNPRPIASGRDDIHIPSHILSWVFIMTSVIVISPLRECEHLRPICAPTRALSRIVLSLTKPKDKI